MCEGSVAVEVTRIDTREKLLNIEQIKENI